LFERNGTVPWREVAQVYVVAAQGVMARRAAYMAIAQASAPGSATTTDQAKAWLALAELELALGNTSDCSHALDASLQLDGASVPALILAAVLADQRGDLAAAITHLERIEHQLKAGAESVPATHDAMLHRQLASLYERSGRTADAEALWQGLCAAGDRSLMQCDYGCFLLRQSRLAEAEELAARILPGLMSQLPRAPEPQLLLRELTIRRVNGQEVNLEASRAACASMLAYEPHLVTSNRILLAQLALAGDDYELMRRQLDIAAGDEPDNRTIRLLRVRLHAATRNHDQAEQLVRLLVEQAPADQEAAVLYAECLVQRGQCDRALAVLDAPALPATPSLERGLLAALLSLDVQGEGACLARLGRLPSPECTSPLVRIFATAWPAAWCTNESYERATLADVRALPALANLARRLGRALTASNRDDLAACLLVTTADQLLARGELGEARRLSAQAVGSLMRVHQRPLAWRMAWRSRRFTELLRLCLP
jgi:hypothetical protein